MERYLRQMIIKANQALLNAYAPYSRFPVGACIRTKSGALFTGCNVENSSYSLTICAESAAVIKMVEAGYKLISDLVIIAQKVDECPPCGACRQRIVEFANKKTMIHLVTKKGKLCASLKMSKLLENPFRFDV